MFTMRHRVVKELLSDTIKNSINLSELDTGLNFIYHCTTFKNVNKLLSSNVFKCHTSYSDETPHICCTYKAYYTVFSDSKIQLVLDKDKLDLDFESKSIDIYGNDYEGEIRYYSDYTEIPNFNKYISKIRISETSLSSLFLHDLLWLNCCFDKVCQLIDGSISLDELDFDDLSEVLKLERLCKQYSIPMCDRLLDLIKLNRELFNLESLKQLNEEIFTLYHEEHIIQKVAKQYYDIRWGNYTVFSGYYNCEFEEKILKIREKYLNLMDKDMLCMYNKITTDGLCKK